ncbi:MAG TPA: ParB N-terminal domain-containing protein [Nitrococcus sp.]|nr:ParB N-terminal domain-containing protein [Nitrococcus sp.]
MAAPVKIPISKLRHRPGARAVDKAQAKALASSIADIGLRTPITVRGVDAIDDGQKVFAYQIIAGQHRYEACRQLGWTEVDCVITEDDDNHAALWEIDENLMRAELSPADRARLTAQRKWYYEQLHPEAAAGAVRARAANEKMGRDVGAKFAPTFTADTAAKTGKSERTVQLDARRGERIDSDVIERVRGTHLDKGSYLDKLAKLEPEKQAEKVERDLAQPEKPKEKAAPEDAGQQALDALKNLYLRANPDVRRAFNLWLASLLTAEEPIA